MDKNLIEFTKKKKKNRELEKYNRRQKVRAENQLQQIRLEDEEHRRQMRETKLREWFMRKRAEQADRLEQLRLQAEVAAPPSSSETTEESVKNYQAWCAKKKQYLKALKEQKQRELDLKNEYDRKKKMVAQSQYVKWLETAKDKPKPVPMNRGLYSMVFFFGGWKY